MERVLGGGRHCPHTVSKQATEQAAALSQLRRVDSDLYMFADERCISSYGQSCGIRIGSHSWKIVEGAVEPPRRS